ncbi:MAG TPA: molecular chaperone DnaJ, partial [Cyanobacteria bacterium UBA8553]|nr:molecular chaperone DnaJ [Cyanobacteria bacterium UBA8553]
NFPQAPVNRSPAWLQGLLDTPTPPDLIGPAVTFLILSGVTVFYRAPDESILPLVLALGVGCNVYFLNRKERQFGRAVLITLIGLIVGVGLGTVLGGLLKAQLTTIGFTGEKFSTMVTFFLFWLISSFLR